MEEKLAILSKKLALSAGVVAFSIFLLIVYLGLFSQPVIKLQFYCGMTDRVLSTQSAQLGKTLFTNNCATCHSKSMKERLTGPALENWNIHIKDPNSMWLFLKDKKSYFKTHKNKKHLKQRKAYGMDCVNFPNLTFDDVQNIISYIDRIR